MRLLERELGVELLRRTTHEVTLTEAGRLLLERAPALLDARRRRCGAASRLRRRRARARVVVGYGTSAGYETAPRLLEAIARRLPGARGQRARHADGGDPRRGRRGRDRRRARALPARARRARGPRAAPRAPGRAAAPRPPAGRARRRSRSPTLGDLAAAAAPARRQPGPLRRRARPLPRGAASTPRCSSAARSLDLAQTPVVDGRAVAIVGESSRVGLPAELTWLPLEPAGGARGRDRRARARALAGRRAPARRGARSVAASWAGSTAMPRRSEAHANAVFPFARGACLASTACHHDDALTASRSSSATSPPSRRATSRRSATLRRGRHVVARRRPPDLRHVERPRRDHRRLPRHRDGATTSPARSASRSRA